MLKGEGVEVAGRAWERMRGCKLGGDSRLKSESQGGEGRGSGKVSGGDYQII